MHASPTGGCGRTAAPVPHSSAHAWCVKHNTKTKIDAKARQSLRQRRCRRCQLFRRCHSQTFTWLQLLLLLPSCHNECHLQICPSMHIAERIQLQNMCPSCVVNDVRVCGWHVRTYVRVPPGHPRAIHLHGQDNRPRVKSFLCGNLHRPIVHSLAAAPDKLILWICAMRC